MRGEAFKVEGEETGVQIWCDSGRGRRVTAEKTVHLTL